LHRNDFWMDELKSRNGGYNFKKTRRGGGEYGGRGGKVKKELRVWGLLKTRYI